MAKIQELVERVMNGYYTKHKQGEQLLVIDLQDLVDEGYLVKTGESPYGILEAENEKLKEEIIDLKAELRPLQEEIQFLERLVNKMEAAQ